MKIGVSGIGSGMSPKRVKLKIIIGYIYFLNYAKMI